MTQYLGVYSVLMQDVSVSTLRTLCQVNAGADQPFEIIRAWVTFDSIVSTSVEIGMKTVSTAGTATAFTMEPHREGVAFAGTASTNHTAEGTLVDEVFAEHVNHLAGFRYLPVPEERFRAVGSERYALYFVTAPAAVSVNAGIVIGLL